MPQWISFVNINGLKESFIFFSWYVCTNSWRPSCRLLEWLSPSTCHFTGSFHSFRRGAFTSKPAFRLPAAFQPVHKETFRIKRTFLASLMPSQLPGLFNKLALEDCSPPSPLAMAGLLECGLRRTRIVQKEDKKKISFPVQSEEMRSEKSSWSTMWAGFERCHRGCAYVSAYVQLPAHFNEPFTPCVATPTGRRHQLTAHAFPDSSGVDEIRWDEIRWGEMKQDKKED